MHLCCRAIASPVHFVETGTLRPPPPHGRSIGPTSCLRGEALPCFALLCLATPCVSRQAPSSSSVSNRRPPLFARRRASAAHRLGSPCHAGRPGARGAVSCAQAVAGRVRACKRLNAPSRRTAWALWWVAPSDAPATCGPLLAMRRAAGMAVCVMGGAAAHAVLLSAPPPRITVCVASGRFSVGSELSWSARAQSAGAMPSERRCDALMTSACVHALSGPVRGSTYVRRAIWLDSRLRASSYVTNAPRGAAPLQVCDGSDVL